MDHQNRRPFCNALRVSNVALDTVLVLAQWARDDIRHRTSLQLLQYICMTLGSALNLPTFELQVPRIFSHGNVKVSFTSMN
jgi:hypothetical protein